VGLRLRVAVVVMHLSVAVRSRMTGRPRAGKTAVIREIQQIPRARIQYLSQFGRFASTLVELGPPASGAAGPTGANIIPASLASAEKDGYVFTMIRTPAGFAVNANPKVFGSTGRRTFYSDENGVVHQNWGRDPATA